ncbi:MAG: ParB/RepB/Spo0J family partition protein [Clostridiales bacterium]|jgi:ParB family chromosome partitioning protein|nr:ParB/RepB/Spo0J family partition protein [Clostridiales bacterium]
MKKGLGRGLNALLGFDGGTEPEENQNNNSGTNGGFSAEGSAQTAEAAHNVRHIDIRKIEPNRQQPRQYFDEAALAELAESIKSFGVIQPLIVKDSGGHFSIIAGERRYRAARMAKLETLPVIVKDYTEMETLQIALIENIQRQDLTPVEEAACYKRLMEDFFFTPEDIAEKVGKNRHAVAGLVKLLELDERVQGFAAEGKLTASHAQALLTVHDGDAQLKIAERIVADGLSVRATEALIAVYVRNAEKQAARERETPEVPEKFNDDVIHAYRKAAEDLKTLLGAKVQIRHGKKKGKIEIEYYSPEELDRLLGLFRQLSI